jgi:hypothetical protein
MSMRLVRMICTKCREPYPLEPARARQLGLQVQSDEPVIAYKGAGCAHCRNTGYFGRTGLFEVLEINDDIRELINQGAPDSTIRLAAIDLGMKTLVEDGLEKVLDGQTTLDEVSRVVYVAEENRRLCPYCSTVLRRVDYCPSRALVGDSACSATAGSTATGVLPVLRHDQPRASTRVAERRCPARTRPPARGEASEVRSFRPAGRSRKRARLTRGASRSRRPHIR